MAVTLIYTPTPAPLVVACILAVAAVGLVVTVIRHRRVPQVKIRDASGRTVKDNVVSDAEACRWWLESGKRGDWLDGGLGGVEVENIVGDVLPDAQWSYGPNGAVLCTNPNEDQE